MSKEPANEQEYRELMKRLTEVSMRLARWLQKNTEGGGEAIEVMCLTMAAMYYKAHVGTKADFKVRVEALLTAINYLDEQEKPQ